MIRGIFFIFSIFLFSLLILFKIKTNNVFFFIFILLLAGIYSSRWKIPGAKFFLILLVLGRILIPFHTIEKAKESVISMIDFLTKETILETDLFVSRRDEKGRLYLVPPGTTYEKGGKKRQTIRETKVFLVEKILGGGGEGTIFVKVLLPTEEGKFKRGESEEAIFAFSDLKPLAEVEAEAKAKAEAEKAKAEAEKAKAEAEKAKAEAEAKAKAEAEKTKKAAGGGTKSSSLTVPIPVERGVFQLPPGRWRIKNPPPGFLCFGQETKPDHFQKMETDLLNGPGRFFLFWEGGYFEGLLQFEKV